MSPNTSTVLEFTYHPDQINKDDNEPLPAMGLMSQGFWMYRKLSEVEEAEFRQAARDNYQPFSNIQGIWHPIYQLECVLINHEHSFYRQTEQETEQEPTDTV